MQRFEARACVIIERKYLIEYFVEFAFCLKMVVVGY